MKKQKVKVKELKEGDVITEGLPNFRRPVKVLEVKPSSSTYIETECGGVYIDGDVEVRVLPTWTAEPNNDDHLIDKVPGHLHVSLARFNLFGIGIRYVIRMVDPNDGEWIEGQGKRPSDALRDALLSLEKDGLYMRGQDR